MIDVVDEIECMTRGHHLSVRADRALVSGVRDDLHRIVMPLMQSVANQATLVSNLRDMLDRLGVHGQDRHVGRHSVYDRHGRSR